MSLRDPVFWIIMEVITTLLFFTAFLITVLLIRQRRRLFLASLTLMLPLYLLLQIIIVYIYSEEDASPVETAVLCFFSLPDFFILILYAASTLSVILLLRQVLIYEKNQITPMSIKEAYDNLPSGLCFYLPGGRVIMKNKTIELFCQHTTGQVLRNGEEFRRALFSGPLIPECRRIAAGQDPVILLPDNSVWSVSFKETPYENTPALMLIASDITEAYHKTVQLREQQEKLEKLNIRLLQYNQEIVDLTAKKEMLRAKIRIHDTLGANLLSMKSFILNGSTEAEKTELLKKLDLDMSFLKNDSTPAAADEYDLMLKTAENLGVRIQITGSLPQTEPQKHILAVAIHECFTNTLRHARGDTLFLTISREENLIRAVFTNNGIQPYGEIREKGGLQSLRALTEQNGGRMIVHSRAPFSITLELSKEETHVI